MYSRTTLFVAITSCQITCCRLSSSHKIASAEITDPNPTPGPAGSKFLSGPRGLTLSRVVRPGRFGAIGLPRLGQLSVRKKDLASQSRREVAQ